MIAALALLAAIAAPAAVADNAVPTTAAVDRGIDFCQQVISQPFAAVPDDWDAYMSATGGSSRVKPLAEAPELVRTVADQFAQGDQLKALLHQRATDGDVWIGTAARTPRCLVIMANGRSDPAPYIDFALRFGLHGTWAPAPATALAGSSGQWNKRIDKTELVLSGFPVGSPQIAFFLLMLPASAASAPRP